MHTADGWLPERFAYWFKSRAWEDQVPGNLIASSSMPNRIARARGQSGGNIELRDIMRAAARPGDGGFIGFDLAIFAALGLFAGYTAGRYRVGAVLGIAGTGR